METVIETRLETGLETGVEAGVETSVSMCVKTGLEAGLEAGAGTELDMRVETGLKTDLGTGLGANVETVVVAAVETRVGMRLERAAEEGTETCSTVAAVASIEAVVACNNAKEATAVLAASCLARGTVDGRAGTSLCVVVSNVGLDDTRIARIPSSSAVNGMGVIFAVTGRAGTVDNANRKAMYIALLQVLTLKETISCRLFFICWFEKQER